MSEEMRLQVPMDQFPALRGLMAYVAQEHEVASDFDESTKTYEIPIRWVGLIPDMIPAVEAIWAEHQKQIKEHDAEESGEEKPYTRLDEFWADDDYDSDNKAEVTLWEFINDWYSSWERADSGEDLLQDTNFATEYVNREIGEFETIGDLSEYLKGFDPTLQIEFLEGDSEIYLSEIPWPVQGGKKLRISTEEM
jgi:hypothetical protein